MKWIAILPVLLAGFSSAGFSSASAQTMEQAFAKNCPRSVLADAATVRLYCACVHRQIIETTAFPEDREASFALIAPSETLAEAMEHGKVLEKLPPNIQRAIEARSQSVSQVIMPLCLMSATTGKVKPDGTIQK